MGEEEEEEEDNFHWTIEGVWSPGGRWHLHPPLMRRRELGQSPRRPEVWQNSMTHRQTYTQTEMNRETLSISMALHILSFALACAMRSHSGTKALNKQ